MKTTIQIKQSLAEAKAAYREYFGISKKEKVSKQDLSQWFSSLVETDIEQ